ncbi:MAG TPA: hypothetical protein VGW80_02125 [Solirubrobacterales bacterium]|nr:hypothetical protein [Solirubrobacterales bacterium]
MVRLRLAIALLFAVVGATAIAGCGSEGEDGAEARPVADHPPRYFRFFAKSSFWNTRLEADQPLDPASEELAGAFAAEVEAKARQGKHPWINTTDYSVPVYKVPEDQPTVRVRLASPYRAPALQAAWRRVPLPPDAEAAEGTDRNLVVYQPASDRLWEFWRFSNEDGEPAAAWGGAIGEVSRSSGAYSPKAWPGAKPWWGSSASSLSIAGGLITFADLRAGRINHALALAIPRVRRGAFASPARRTDGTAAAATTLPEGAHLRLDPNLDLSTLGLPPLTLMIARAAKHYGIFVRDRAGVAHFFAQDPGPLRGNPYRGEDGYFEGSSPGDLLAGFPWSHLQVLPMKLHPYDPIQPQGPR